MENKLIVSRKETEKLIDGLSLNYREDIIFPVFSLKKG